MATNSYKETMERHNLTIGQLRRYAHFSKSLYRRVMRKKYTPAETTMILLVTAINKAAGTSYEAEEVFPKISKGNRHANTGVGGTHSAKAAEVKTPVKAKAAPKKEEAEEKNEEAEANKEVKAKASKTSPEDQKEGVGGTRKPESETSEVKAEAKAESEDKEAVEAEPKAKAKPKKAKKEAKDKDTDDDKE